MEGDVGSVVVTVLVELLFYVIMIRVLVVLMLLLVIMTHRLKMMGLVHTHGEFDCDGTVF